MSDLAEPLASPVDLDAKDTSCVKCRRLKKRCTRVLGAASCERCEKAGIECVEGIRKERRAQPRALVIADIKARQSVCVGCHSQRKKCDLLRPSCSRCEHLGNACVYPEAVAQPSSGSLPGTASASSSASGTPPEDTIVYEYPSVVAPSSASVLDQIVAHFNWNLIRSSEKDQSFKPTSIESIELMPTAFDFSLLANFIYTQPLMFRNSFLMFDPFRLLESFFREPPALRLSLCAIVADAIRLPEEVCLSYYSRARKALLRITEPSLKAIQALYLCATFALMNGQVALGIPAMDRAIHMLLDLNLEHDPDDNP